MSQALIADYDIVADGSDNFETRFLLNDACYLREEDPGLGGGDRIRRPARDLQGLGPERRLSLLSLPVSRPAAAGHRAQLFGDRRAGRRGRRDGIAAGPGSAQRRSPASGESLAGKILITDALATRFRTVSPEPRSRLPALRCAPGHHGRVTG